MSRSARTVVVAGGGTGGRVCAALAVAEALRKRGHHVLYYGDPLRLERRMAAERDIPFRAVSARPWPRSGVAGRLRAGMVAVVATLQAARQLRRDGVDLVLGVGGYASLPAVAGAWLLRIPRAIHEADVLPGLASRVGARMADLVLLSYPQAAARLAPGVPQEVVGCPVDAGMLADERPEALRRYELDPDRPVLLVTGGSGGAPRLNALALAAIRDPRREYQVLCITGPDQHDEMLDALGASPPGVALVPFEARMGAAYGAADLVLCRAGTSTLAELTALGKPSVLVPAPNVANNYQEANANALETAGAAMVFPERSLREASLLDRLARLLRDRLALRVMGEAAASLGRRDAADRIADLLLDRARTRRTTT